MSQLNVSILNDLKAFLNEVSINSELTNLFRNSQTDFTRKRKLCFQNLTLLIVRLCKKTLSVELDDFFSEIESPKSCSVPAFTQQRAKLKPSFFNSWNHFLWRSFYHYYGKRVKLWNGYKVIGCDGSSISLVNRPELNEYFGGQSNQNCSFVIAKTFYCYDVLNKMILYSKITPYRYGELRSAYDVLTKVDLDSNMLMIFDRNFSNYKMAALMQWKEKEIKYIIRAKESLRYVKSFLKSGKDSDVVNIYPAETSIKGLKECGYTVSSKTPLKVRLILVKLSSGITEVLMTNLWEEEGFMTSEFKELYSLRWGVESNIGFQKNILQLESLSGLTPTSVMQDFYATVFTTNLHFLLIKDAQSEIERRTIIGKYPLQVNNNKAFGKIKKHLIELFLSEEPEKLLRTLTGIFIRAPLPIRKNRSYPRLRKNPQSKSKFRTFTNYKPAY
jgi:hypothetical protein